MKTKEYLNGGHFGIRCIAQLVEHCIASSVVEPQAWYTMGANYLLHLDQNFS